MRTYQLITGQSNILLFLIRSTPISSDNANFVLRCDYNFNAQQYDFQFYGVTPGTANVTLYYFTADGVKIPVNMTINVDNDLNVTQA